MANSYQNIVTAKGALKCFYVNACSIVKPGKLDELKCVLESFNTQIHIIIVTETWIKSEEEAKRLQLPNYTHYYNYRSTRGGGVSIFAHNNLQHHLILEQSINNNHYLWICLSKFSVNIGAVYRTNRGNVDNFLDTLSLQLQNNKRSIVVGDFNLDLLKSEKSVLDYKRTLKENGYKVINKINRNFCTRETAKTKTLIDHVCSNLTENNYHLAIIDSTLSDHKQINFEVKKIKPRPIEKLRYTAINYGTLYETVKEAGNENEESDYAVLEHKLLLSISKSIISKKLYMILMIETYFGKH